MTQQEALDILKTGANVFLTGEPGAGKTHTVNEYVAYLRSHGMEPAICASTGIAATHIGGMTIHSWSGIGIKTRLDQYELDKIASSERTVKRVKRTNVLIIDEISMLAAETLSMVDAVCREIRQSPEPFGGLQVVLVGDFFQLPPIMRDNERNSPRRDESYEEPDVDSLFAGKEVAPRFACDAPVWRRSRFLVCYLTEQYRQDDSDFLSLLSAIRSNEFSEAHLRHIEKRKITHDASPGGVPKLFSHNADVDRVNNATLAKLSGTKKVFEMTSRGARPLVETLKKGCLSPETLELKIGAAVMFTKNNPREGFVNGTLGTVVGFDKENGQPVVKLRSGRLVSVSPLDWAVEESGVVRARITQIPLRLAWAITVHKSQGMSLDEAVMDLSSVFEFGQGYVALSRVRRLSGLYLLGWNERTFQVHPEILIHDASFRQSSEEAREFFGGMEPDALLKMHKNFLTACGGSHEKVVSKSNKEVIMSGPGRKAHMPREGMTTYQETLALLKDGNTILRVAAIRDFSISTIVAHVEKLYIDGHIDKNDVLEMIPVEIRQDVPDIKKIFQESGDGKLAPVFAMYSGKYSYEDLRLIRILA
jgi:hypothetical protein